VAAVVANPLKSPLPQCLCLNPLRDCDILSPDIQRNHSEGFRQLLNNSLTRFECFETVIQMTPIQTSDKVKKLVILNSRA